LETRKNVVYGEILYTDQPVLLWWQNARNMIIKVSNYHDFVQLDLHRSPAETLTSVCCTKSSVQINNKFCTGVLTGYISVNFLLPTGTGLKLLESTACFREMEVNPRCHRL